MSWCGFEHTLNAELSCGFEHAMNVEQLPALKPGDWDRLVYIHDDDFAEQFESRVIVRIGPVQNCAIAALARTACVIVMPAPTNTVVIADWSTA